MTKEQVLMIEHELIGEAVEWGNGQEKEFTNYVSGMEAVISKILEEVRNEEAKDENNHRLH